MAETQLDSEIDLLGTVAHDLKTPISSIKSYADLIAHAGDLNEHQQHYLGRIYQAVQQMNNLVNDLLDLVWVEEGMDLNRAPCNLLDVVRGQVSALEGYAAERNVALHLTHAADLTLVQADERRLAQVVNNLVGNGIKYNRDGGSVRIHVSRQAEALRVSVRDDGFGIEAEDLPHVFERFFRARRAEATRIEGSGLGLSIAQAIVKQHGGSISATSTPGEGSEFVFTIPLAPQHTED
ncbi:MAG: HAMP domain-containing histidine kinase [Anaerolineae bacterium]|nr:HAMP domain-containing histidine kinase [Anaerolineae bacterium]